MKMRQLLGSADFEAGRMSSAVQRFGQASGPALLAVALALYFALGVRFASAGMLSPTFDNLLFQADIPRVVENSTDLTGPQGRTRVHPLHVLMTAPLGRLVALLVSRELAAALLCALAAVAVLGCLDLLLRARTSLRPGDRALLVAMLGASASHVTFAVVPETHILSAAGLAAMALHLGRRRQGGRPASRGLGAIPAIFAVGALVTNVMALPAYRLLQDAETPRAPLLRRLSRAAAFTAAVVLTVAVLHAAQRALIRERTPETLPSTAMGSESRQGERRPPTPSSPDLWARFAENLRFFTTPTDLPGRALRMANSVFVVSVFAPELDVAHPERARPAVSFDFSRLPLRTPGALGLFAWSLLLLIVGRDAVRSGTWRELLRREPAFAFCAFVLALQFGVFSLYGDDLFLFSPNWVFSEIVLVGYLLGGSLVGATALKAAGMRALLGGAAGATAWNSALHVGDLFRLYAS